MKGRFFYVFLVVLLMAAVGLMQPSAKAATVKAAAAKAADAVVDAVASVASSEDEPKGALAEQILETTTQIQQTLKDLGTVVNTPPGAYLEEAQRRVDAIKVLGGLVSDDSETFKLIEKYEAKLNDQLQRAESAKVDPKNAGCREYYEDELRAIAADIQDAITQRQSLKDVRATLQARVKDLEANRDLIAFQLERAQTTKAKEMINKMIKSISSLNAEIDKMIKGAKNKKPAVEAGGAQ